MLGAELLLPLPKRHFLSPVSASHVKTEEALLQAAEQKACSCVASHCKRACADGYVHSCPDSNSSAPELTLRRESAGSKPEPFASPAEASAVLASRHQQCPLISSPEAAALRHTPANQNPAEREAGWAGCQQGCAFPRVGNIRQWGSVQRYSEHPTVRPRWAEASDAA